MPAPTAASKKNEIRYVYRGAVERGTGRGYRWHDGYSADSPGGGIQYPWMTKREAQRDAKAQGARAVFVRERQIPSTKHHHATKKSPAQLQREIDEVLAKPVRASKETSVLPPSVRVARAGLESVREHGIKNLRYGLYRHAGDRAYQWGNFTGTPEDVITAVVPNARNTASQEALVRALKWKR